MEIIVIMDFKAPSGNTAAAKSIITEERVATSIAWDRKPSMQDIDLFNDYHNKKLAEIGLRFEGENFQFIGMKKTEAEKNCEKFLDDGTMPEGTMRISKDQIH
jgi:hypothetical protein